jgi:hypothetical protein
VLICGPAFSQSNAPPAGAPSLGDDLSSIGKWAGNINTNYHFADVLVWDGPVYLNQVNVANELGGSYDIWHSDSNPLTTNGVIFGALEGRFRQAGIAGTWVSEAGGFEFGWQKCDFRAGLFVDGVYLNQPAALGSKHRESAEFGVFVDKMLSSASALGLFVADEPDLKYPLLGANLNISFGNGTGFLGLFKH